MKKTVLISIYLFLVLSLYAATYSSNSIGQKLGLYDGESMYYLIETVNNETTVQKLYKDETLVQTKSIQLKDDIKTVTLDDMISKVVSTFSNNYLISEKHDLLQTNYNYADNMLESKIVTFDDEIVEIYAYNYTSDDKLSSILKVIPNKEEVFYFFSIKDEYQSLSVSDSETFKKSKIQNGVINSLEYQNDKVINNIEVETVDKNKVILIDRSGNTIVKDSFTKGVLNKKEIYDENEFLIKVEEFFYDDNYSKLRQITTEKIYNSISKQYDKEKVEEIVFKNNKIENVTIKENGEKVSSYYFDQNGRKIENLYENNKLFCTIVYKDDKIIDIQYREVNK